uniref:cytochrome c oxidase subunit III n=1 Tax=Poecilobdella javanica TaxID=1348077 RepID=UPI001F1392F7|nr:cytochrome c oxidase subunit III [Poecilobdella javanica]ULO25925.1 cytochrome c oxidase subunit 3 [Poecilobdella javanica]
MIRMPFHLVEPSPWPLLASSSALMLTMGLTKWFHYSSNKLCIVLGMVMLMLSMFVWWRDVVRESTYSGMHTKLVMKGLKVGMILFITSEVCFFFGFFWSFFHSSLSPTPDVGCIWPPMGVITLNTFGVPLLNTIVLLSSGVTVTWAHHSLKRGMSLELKQALVFTIMLGLYFTMLQLGEYYHSPFSIADSVYGSVFFVATGFHGIHVIIGTLFLSISLFRSMFSHYCKDHHFGFEAAAWYWHFVDVVWICLYLCIYWWGS